MKTEGLLSKAAGLITEVDSLLMEVTGLVTKVNGSVMDVPALMIKVNDLVTEVTGLLTELDDSVTDEVIGFIAEAHLIINSLMVYKRQILSVKYYLKIINNDYPLNSDGYN